MSKGRILVVEDNPDNMTLVEDILLSLGYDVLQAPDGERGVEIAYSEMPDLILMDLALPKMDGWTAARQIKTDPATCDIPIIALTAHAMVGDRERAIESGCDDYVTKPVDVSQLAQKITQYLG